MRAPLVLAALLAALAPARADEAIFAGGCFWCMEGPFDGLDGVGATISGYAGGKVDHPSYQQVSTGTTGHAEAVQVTYDPARVSYEKLLDVYWRNIDPFARDAQFCDHGPQYRSAIFPLTDEQRAAAEASKAAMEERFGQKLATRIETPGAFWPAEDYHQDYYQTHPIRYHFYRNACGRDGRLREIWGDEAGGGH